MLTICVLVLENMNFIIIKVLKKHPRGITIFYLTCKATYLNETPQIILWL